LFTFYIQEKVTFFVLTEIHFKRVHREK